MADLFFIAFFDGNRTMFKTCYTIMKYCDSFKHSAIYFII